MDFEIRFLESRGLRFAKGGVTGPPEIMREAFKQGRGRLELDDGQELAVSFIAHTDGSAMVYFESAPVPYSR